MTTKYARIYCETVAGHLNPDTLMTGALRQHNLPCPYLLMISSLKMTEVMHSEQVEARSGSQHMGGANA